MTEMKKQSVSQAIMRRVRARGRGCVFSQRNFMDAGGRSAVDQAISRLVKRGAIRRLARGLFDYPRISKRLGVLAPDPDAVARALAHKSNGIVQSSGAMAANRLGLSTQVPAKNVYLTDGSSKTVMIGAQTIVLRHAAPSRMTGAGSPVGDALQALRYLGKRGVNDGTTATLRNLLSRGDKRLLLSATAAAPAWLQPITRKVSAPD